MRDRTGLMAELIRPNEAPVSTGDQQSDERLMLAISKGDEDSLGLLYDRYGKLSFSLAYRILGDDGQAEDVVQEAFIKVWRMAGSYNAVRGSARTWLLSVVHHQAVDACRSRRGAPPLEISAEIEATLRMPTDVWDEVAGNLDREALLRALAQIPEDQRTTIELAYFRGYTHREIADLAKIPLGTVKGRIRIGMDKLRELLIDQKAVR